MSLEATGQSEQPGTDRTWSIETNGINVVPDGERHGRPSELFWVWFAANISVLAVVYGVIAVSFGLNVWQAVLAAWAAVFLVDLATLRRDGYDIRALYGPPEGTARAVNPAGVVAWLVGVVVGLGLITSTTKGFTWLGWWAKGAFAGSSLGLLVAFVAAGLLYGLWAVPAARREHPQPAVQTGG
jgi:purine-cytosine permease-like protein